MSLVLAYASEVALESAGLACGFVFFCPKRADQWLKCIILVNQADAVLFTVREKEKPYYPEQEDPEVVQPYAAYSPAGHPKVKRLQAHCVISNVLGFIQIQNLFVILNIQFRTRFLQVN